MKLSIERTIEYQPAEGPALKVTLTSCNVLTTGRYEHVYMPAAREWYIAATEKAPEDVVKTVRDNPAATDGEIRWLFWLADRCYGWALTIASIRTVSECVNGKWKKISIPESWFNPGSYMESLPDDLSDELMIQARVCNPHMFQPTDAEKKIGVLRVT